MQRFKVGDKAEIKEGSGIGYEYADQLGGDPVTILEVFSDGVPYDYTVQLNDGDTMYVDDVDLDPLTD